eukprot:scaffold53253_cov65-Phaeocystis_antarctica.AAC.1
MELYQKILSGALFADLPAGAPRLDRQTDRHARGLIESLVLRKPEARLTCSAREQSGLMRHPFFGATDWVALQQRKLPAPYVPAIGDALDTRLFEQTEEPPTDDGPFDTDAATAAFADWSSSGKEDDGKLIIVKQNAAAAMWKSAKRRMSITA